MTIPGSGEFPKIYFADCRFHAADNHVGDRAEPSLILSGCPLW